MQTRHAILRLRGPLGCSFEAGLEAGPGFELKCYDGARFCASEALSAAASRPASRPGLERKCYDVARFCASEALGVSALKF